MSNTVYDQEDDSDWEKKRRQEQIAVDDLLAKIIMESYVSGELLILEELAKEMEDENG